MHGNNGTLVRLIASLFVLIQHAWMVTGRPDPTGSTGYLPWIGHIGVLMFFALSGYLLTTRVLVDDIRRFIVSRAFRIYPLLIAVNIAALAIGAVITTKTLGEYFGEGALGIVFRNLIYYGQQELPGVRLGADYVGAFGLSTNLPQWSLFYELRAYALLILLALGGIVADRRTFNVVLFVVVLLVPVPNTWLHWGDARAFDVTLAFLFGAALAANKIRLDGKLAGCVVMVAALATLLGLSYSGVLLNLAIATLTLYCAFGTAPYVKIADTKTDISYGLFLLHWPVLLAVTSWLPPSPRLLLLVTAIVTCAVAYAANMLIEEPARKLGHRLGRRLANQPSKTEAATWLGLKGAPAAVTRNLTDPDASPRT